MLKRILFGNMGMKLMALVMALCLWLYAMRQDSRELTKVHLPVEIIVPPETVLFRPESPVIEADLRGPQVVMDRVDGLIVSGRFKAKYIVNTPLDEFHDTRTEEIDPRRIVLPDDAMDVEITRVAAQDMEITIARSIEKRLSVDVPKEGALPPGYRVSSEATFPSSVSVLGPKHLLDRVDAIKTRPFDLSAVPAKEGEIVDYLPLVPEVKVQINGKTTVARVKISERQGKMIRLRMGISQALEERQFKDIGIKILRPVDFPYDVRLTDGDSVDLVIKGPRSELEALNTILADKRSIMKVFVDVSELKPTIGADSGLNGAETGNPPHRLDLFCHFPSEFPNLRLAENTEKIKVDIIQRHELEIKQSAEARK